MKAGHDQTQIDKRLDRKMSTISHALNRNTGSRGYAERRDQRGQIPDRRPLSERPRILKPGSRLVIRNAIRSYMVKPQGCSGDNGRAQVRICSHCKGTEKTSELVSSAIVDKLKPIAFRVKTLT